MNINGKLNIEKVKLSQKGTPDTRPLELDFAVQHDLRKHSGMLNQGDIHIGAALAHLTGSYAEQGDSIMVHMKLAGPNMSVPELETLLPALGVVLPAGTRLDGGTMKVALTMEGPADKLVTTGSIALENSRLRGFDLSQKMSSIEKLAGIKGGPDTEIQTLAANFRVAPEGASAQDMKLVAPALGDLSGAGTVSPANDLDFKMSATVHTSGVLAVVGNTPIPFLVQGTCANPVFKPDLKAVAKEEVKAAEGQLQKAAGGVLKGLLGGKKK